MDETVQQRDAVEAAVARLSGAELGSFLSSLPEMAELNGYSLVEAIEGWEKVARHARAQVLRAVGELGRRRDVQAGNSAAVDQTDPRAPQVAVFATSEVSLALGISYPTAQGLLADAVTLAARLPVVLEALEAGRVCERAASVLASETLVLDPELAARVADTVLQRPGLRTLAQVRRATRTLVARADPAGAAGREARAVRGRFIRPRKDVEDGMVAWEAWLPVADSVAIWDRLGELGRATTVPDDPRTLDARRADVAADLLLGRPVLCPDGQNLNQHTTSTAKVWRTDVVVEATTLAGRDDHPALIPGWGTITADTARRLAADLGTNGDGGHEKGDDEARDERQDDRPDEGPDERERPGPAPEQSGGSADRSQLSRRLGKDGQWRRMMTDRHSGLVTDYGITRYRPPRALADYVRARDGRCYEPYCLCSAWRGDLDHITNSPAGPSPRPDPNGRTSAANLGAGCRRGHNTKAAPGWSVESPTEGTFNWTTPTGHVYTRRPEPPIDWYGQPDIETAGESGRAPSEVGHPASRSDDAPRGLGGYPSLDVDPPF